MSKSSTVLVSQQTERFENHQSSVTDMCESSAQVFSDRPLFIDAVRFHFIRSILFDSTESRISFGIGKDGSPSCEAELSVKLPLPSIFPVDTVEWRDAYIDSVVDYWIDRSALGLLSQCVEEWKKLDLADVHGALKKDAERYVVARQTMLDAISDSKIYSRKSNGSVMNIHCKLPVKDELARHFAVILSNPSSECDDILKAFEASIDDAKSHVLESSNSKLKMNITM